MDPGIKLSDEYIDELIRAVKYVYDKSGYHINATIHHLETREDFRKYMSSMIFLLIKKKDEYIRFTACPILTRHPDKAHVHIGLSHSIPLSDIDVYLRSLSSLYIMITGTKYLGPCYVTTITLIPSFVEAFIRTTPNSWPNPDKNLRSAPREFRNILDSLQKKYIDKELHYLSLDKKHFIMTEEDPRIDGYTVDFHSLPYPQDIKYLNFCRSWLNYEKFEHMILVGKVGWLSMIRVFFLIQMTRLIAKFKG
jgi:hypothetical protein